MTYDDIRVARQNGQTAIDMADTAVKGAAKLIAGRLRASMPNPKHGDGRDALTKLKRELRDFDMVTGNWKTSR